MRITHVLLIILGAIVFLMIGSFLFLGVFAGISSIQDVYKDVQRLYDHRIVAGLMGIFFICMAYFAVKILIKASHRDEIFVVDNEYGRTSISLLAVDDLVKKTLKKYETIKRCSVRVRSQQRILVVNISLVVWSGKQTAEIVQKVQEELKKKLITFVGLTSDTLNIVVKITKVIERKEKDHV